MLRYLLDTNICIYILKNYPAKVRQKFESLEDDEVGLSSICVAELLLGVQKNPDKNKHTKDFISNFKILSFGVKEAITYAKIRSKLESAGYVIGSMDMLIASVALANDLVLVTNNQKEFARISNCKLQNWA